MSGAGLEDTQAARMRAGVRAGVAGRARIGLPSSSLRRLSPAALVGVLCASALAPVVAAGVGAGAVVVAGVAVFSSVGTSVLSNVVIKAIDQLRGDGRQPTQAEIERELAAGIEKTLTVGDAQAEALRTEVAAVLREVDAVRVALAAAVETGNYELQHELAAAFAALHTEFGEFGFVLADIREAAAVIQETLRRQNVEHRADRDLARQQWVQLQLLRDELAVIERRTRSGESGLAGRDAGWEDCPYRGLWPFTEEHVGVFYGREQVTAELVSTLAERLVGLGMLVVTGASGVGKSSLLRAGLLPAVACGSLTPGSQTWPRIVITPTRAPVEELATHLAALGGMDATSVCRELTRAPDRAHLVVRQLVLAAARGPSGHDSAVGGGAERRLLLVVVDQFEEIFTLSRDQDEAAQTQRAVFLTVLHTVASAPVGPGGEPAALVVLGVRGDFWDRCAAHSQLAEALRAGPFLVAPMGEPELRRAIIGPAAAAGLTLEVGLTETIMGDLRGSGTPDRSTGGALPLLSQAMLVTWQHREEGRLTSRGYGLAGGVAGAVQASAEAAYQGLSPARRDLAGRVLRALTVVARDGQLARRRMRRVDLATAGSDGRAPDLDVVLDAFADRRLVVLSDGTVEIAHDVLLRAWPRLRDWLAGDQTDRALYGQLMDDAAGWHDHHRDGSFLYRGAQLTTVRQAALRWDTDPDRYPVLTVTEQEFLTASRRAAKRGTHLRRAVIAVLVVLTLVAGSGAVAAGMSAADATRQRVNADRQHDIALSRQLAAQSQTIHQTSPITAKRLAVAAWHIAPTDEAHNAMTTLLAQARTTLDGTLMSFSPDSKVLAIADSEGDVVRLWDPATGRPVGSPLTGHPGGVSWVVFSPDSKVLATAGNEGDVVRLWDPATGRTRGRLLTGHSGGISWVAFSPDSKVLATAGNEGDVVRLWDPATGRPVGSPLTGHPGGVSWVVFSRDSKVLATAGYEGDVVRLWDPATGRARGRLLTGHPGGVSWVVFSRDSKVLATAGNEGDVVRLWDPATGRPVGSPLTGHPGGVYEVVFSPDSKVLATAGYEGDVVRLWDPATGRPVGSPLTGHPGGVSWVAFSPDSKVLATGGAKDGVVRLWDPATGRPVGSPVTGHPGVVEGEFSSDSKILLTLGDGDETVRLWDSATGRPVGSPLTGHPGGVHEVVFSPDGKIIATAGAKDHKVRLWVPPPYVDPFAMICALVGSPTQDEWNRYAPNEPLPRVCP